MDDDDIRKNGDDEDYNDMSNNSDSSNFFNSNESSPDEYSSDSGDEDFINEGSAGDYSSDSGEEDNANEGEVGEIVQPGVYRYTDEYEKEVDDDLSKNGDVEDYNDMWREDEETKTFHSIFLLNPLTLYFLSGFALQLFVFSCEHDHHNSSKRNKILSDQSNIRMNRWWCLFKKHCAQLFETQHAEYEKEAIERSRSPQQLYSQLLIGSTEEMIKAVNVGYINMTVFNKLKVWLKLIYSIKGTTLWNTFVEEDRNHLKELVLKLNEELSSGMQHHSDVSNCYEYPHFSPHAHFIRCSFIVFITNDSHDDNYQKWEYCSSMFLSQHFSISEYLSTDKRELNQFLPNFPYIHHLPCSGIYELWTGIDQLTHPVPLYDIFLKILTIFQGRMTSYENWKQNTLCDEQLTVFEFVRIVTQVKEYMKQERKQVGNCEKQSRRQQKKRKLHSNKNQNWMKNFLFSYTHHRHFQQMLGPHQNNVAN